MYVRERRKEEHLKLAGFPSTGRKLQEEARSCRKKLFVSNSCWRNNIRPQARNAKETSDSWMRNPGRLTYGKLRKFGTVAQEKKEARMTRRGAKQTGGLVHKDCGKQPVSGDIAKENDLSTF